jgi:formyl-CoA transferase
VENALFAVNRARIVHLDALKAEMEPILLTRTRVEWVAALEAVGVPAAQIHSIPEALAHAQVQALGMFQAVPGEDFSLTAMPLRLDGVRPAIAHGAPRLGQDNAALGLSKGAE